MFGYKISNIGNFSLQGQRLLQVSGEYFFRKGSTYFPGNKYWGSTNFPGNKYWGSTYFRGVLIFCYTGSRGWGTLKHSDKKTKPTKISDVPEGT